MSALVYGLYEAKLDLLTSSAYSSLSHSVWALGLAWVVVVCSTGYGGVINKVLSSSILYPFSRVTYCAYLIHPLIIRFMIIHLDSPLHLNKEIVVSASNINENEVSASNANPQNLIFNFFLFSDIFIFRSNSSFIHNSLYHIFSFRSSSSIPFKDIVTYKGRKKN